MNNSLNIGSKILNGGYVEHLSDAKSSKPSPRSARSWRFCPPEAVGWNLKEYSKNAIPQLTTITSI